MALTTRAQLLNKELVDKEAAVKAATVHLEQCSEVIKGCKLAYDAAEGAVKLAEQEIVKAEKRDQIISLQKSRVSLQQTISKLHDLQAAVDTYTAEAQASAIDQEIFNALRALDSAASEAEIEARVASAQLVFKPEPLQHAFIDDKEIAPGEPVSIAEPTTVRLRDWGTIEITPGGADTAQLLKTAKFKRQKFAAALRKIGVASIQDASDLLDKRKQLMSEIEQYKSSIKMLSGGDTLPALQNNLQKIETQIRSHELDSHSALASSSDLGTESGSKSDLKSEAKDANAAGDLDHFRKARDLARESERKARQVLDTAKQKASEATTALNTRTSELSNLRNSAAEVERQLTELSKVAIDIHEKSANDAERTYLEAQDRAKLIALKIGEINADAIKKQHESSKAHCARIERDISALQIALSGLSGEISAEGNMGLGENLERLRGENELAQKNLSRIEKRALALKLLHETLAESEREAKEHFFEPVLDKLAPHLQIMFPGSSIILDKQDVEIAHLNRNGVNETYATLSTGTREQLSVLTRLAIARLLKERNQPSFVVLDDALVYSDANRFAKMKEVLQEVAADVQILILTCRRADYEDMAKANFIDFHSQPR